jgi:hypothetical protein
MKTRNCISKEIIRTLTESTRYKQKVEEINDNVLRCERRVITVKQGPERLKIREGSKGA